MTTLLFVSYGGGHAPALIPVIKQMQARGYHCDFLALTTAAALAEKEGVSPLHVNDFVDSSDANIKKWGEKLAQKHHTDGKGILREESVAYLGVSFCNLADEMGEDQAWRLYEENGLNAFCPIAFMQSVFKKLQPDIVIATTSPRMEKAALKAAHRSNIKSLCMIELFGILEHAWLSQSDHGSYVTVSRQDTKDRLVAAGRDEEAILMTGSPMFDGLGGEAFIQKGLEWRKRRNVPDNKKIVFWAEQPEPDDESLPRKIRVLLADICKRQNWQLVVRLHPSSTDPKNEIIPENVIQSHADEALHDVIAGCDVAVTLTSTVGWEALLAKKPLLVATVSFYSDMVSYGDKDGALAVDSIEKMEDGLVCLLSENETSKELAELRQKLPKPGGATEKICDLLEKMTHQEGNK